MDSETFQGIHTHLPELGSQVIQAVGRSEGMPAGRKRSLRKSTTPTPGRSSQEAHKRSTSNAGGSREPSGSGGPVVIPAAQASDQDTSNMSSLNSSLQLCAGLQAGSTVPAQHDMESGTTPTFAAPGLDSHTPAGLSRPSSFRAGGVKWLLQGGQTASSDAMQHPSAPSPRGGDDNADEQNQWWSGLPWGNRGRQPEDNVRKAGANRSLTSNEEAILVIDMGIHKLQGIQEPVHIIQALPPGLEARAAYFEPLNTLQQKTPGYFDAPATKEAPLPVHGCEVLWLHVHLTEVTLVFCAIDNYKNMLEANQ